MEAQHERIIGRARGPARAEDAPHAFTQLAKPPWTRPAGQADLLAIGRQQTGEGLGSNPDARLAGVDVGVDAENTASLGRTVGKSIDMQQIVTCRRPQTAGCLLERAETGSVRMQALVVAGQF